MKALMLNELGGIEHLTVGDLPSPTLGDGQVRLGVKAAGINFPDILMAEGKYQVKPDLPFVPGLECAGVVLECGAGVTHLRPGDHALGFARRGGAFAEEAILPGDIVTPIPDDMSFETAAAFPVAYGTAHFALDHRGNLQPGETLLVLGAAGGVGIAAIEVGKLMGARVIAAAGGADKLAACKAHGADEVIDYRTEDLRIRVKELTDDKGADVVFDPVGGDAFRAAARAIAWEGRILIIGFASGDIAQAATNMILVKNYSVIGAVFGEHSWRFPAETRARIAGLLPYVAEGKLNPRVWSTFPLEDARKALIAMQDRQVIGKMVLTL